MRPRDIVNPLALTAVAVLALVGVVSTARSAPAAGERGGASSDSGAFAPVASGAENNPGGPSSTSMTPTWKQIDKLVDDQKYSAALDAAEVLLDSLREGDDEAGWGRALILVAQLETGLHGYETAVKRLRSETWPRSTIPLTAVDLYYAHGLTTYRRVYSWDIEQREKTVSDETVDLDAWTGEQISTEADRAFSSIWERREALGSEPLGALEAYLVANDYPRGVRATVRDSIAYLWVELLADSSLWTPRQHQDVYLLDVADLISGSHERPAPGAIFASGMHPLEKISSILGDLERWHLASGRAEAALEARLERLRRLQSQLSQTEDRELLEEELRRIVADVDVTIPWWSMAAAELAGHVRGSEDPWRLVEARDIAVRGRDEHPTSHGGRRCAALVAELEMPDYSLESMETDGLDRRSIEVRHRNLERLFFRAFRIDLEERIRHGDDFDLLPGRREVERALARRRAEYQWDVELERTPDLDFHRSFVTPEIDTPGMYLVVASATADFGEQGNHLEALVLNLSDLVLAVRRPADHFEVTVRSGRTGSAVEGVGVDLYAYDWSRRGHRLVDGGESGDDGRIVFAPTEESSTFFVVASDGEQVAFEPRGHWIERHPDEGPDRSALVYTDRSVYRPAQSILWKIVAYEGRSESGRFETVPKVPVTVALVDANFETVEEIEVETNEFGSASGRFEIPTGRLLGSWTVRTSIGGSTRVAVEEYKRPTFEVAIDEAGSELRLNRAARLTGTARYYFGLPVVDADVRWRVTRLPVYPRWWSWWYGQIPQAEARTVASGRGELDENGRFSVDFLPAVDEREAETGVSFSYQVTAEVTDAGGETRSAERRFRLGFVSVEAAIADAGGFFVAGESAALELLRSDLDGAPREGVGRWRLVSLERPARAPLPAEVPVERPRSWSGGRPPFFTAGDDLRPRWAGVTEPEQVLRSWAEADELVSGEARHGPDGRAILSLGALPAGAYRLLYETSDEHGGRFELQRDLVVADERMALELPVVLSAERASVRVGETARFVVHSGLPEQELELEIFHGDDVLERRVHVPARDGSLVEVAVGPRHRGGISVRLTGIRDHQVLARTAAVFVPWDDRRLALSFSSFRDRLRPGSDERWSVEVRAADEGTLTRASAEVLAYMYDRSLDLFARHDPPNVLELYPRWGAPRPVDVTLGSTYPRWRSGRITEAPDVPSLRGDRLRFLEAYGIGGMGRRQMRLGDVEMVALSAPPPAPSAAVADEARAEAVETDVAFGSPQEPPGDEAGGKEQERPAALGDDSRAPRADFSETAFWEPHLRLAEDGAVSFEFTVPDSLTEWSVWVHALTEDLRSGRLEERAVSARELMVRPYLPRFLREGDEIELRAMVSNGGESVLEGEVDVVLLDPQTGADVRTEFGLDDQSTSGLRFEVDPGGSVTFPFRVRVPSRVGEVDLTVTARAGDHEDGERRALPILPGRMHLARSRFAALRDAERRELRFPDLAAGDDPSRIDEQLVVTIDAQLFYGVLHALPYLATFPYECTEQTLNRFLSTSILATIYDSYPAVQRMAEEFSQRETRLDPWVLDDPNRRMALEETPWLQVARGGRDETTDLVNVLDPEVAASQERLSLAKLEKAQTASGGFPWWPGGPPSPYMTLYLLSGFSRALEFGVDVPRPMIERAWAYTHRHYLDEMVRRMTEDDCCWELVTFLNYVLSAYPDESWSGGVFTAGDRQRMLDFSFRHWKEHSPLLKGYLALTLLRENRREHAELVFDSVMDSARTDPDLGTYWAPEDRSWIWYNDTIETHAFALRVLTELRPDDERRHGLVHWLLLNKKLNQWKSTRATGEVIYALVHYLAREGTLGTRETIDVKIGERRTETMLFDPDEYSGRNRQLVVPGTEIEPTTDATIVVEKTSPGLAFASATWHFSTERLPDAAQGDLFSVERSYFKRELEDDEWVLRPLEEGTRLQPGDQVEVRLTIRAAHAAEYIHVRDPRPAGFEPEVLTSGYKWRSGIAWYEEIKDSGTSFFVEWLPAGEYTLEYRIRANLPGVFKAAPARLQSMYAPEFAAHSAGHILAVAN